MIISLIMGSLLLAGNAVELPPLIAGLFPVYIHLFIVGWITQIIFGVAWWMFPVINFQKGLIQRGDSKLAWLLYILLNTGIVLRTVSEPSVSLNPQEIWVFLLVASSIIQVIAGIIFAVILWPRIKPKKIRSRQVGTITES